MRGVNKAIIVGNVGADPETRYTQGGTAVTEIRVATSEQWTDKQTGDKQERTEWHRITFWGRLAEIAGEYIKKGSAVYVEGQIQTEKYTDKDGVDRYSTKIRASELQLLGGSQRQQAAQNGQQQQEGVARRQEALDKARKQAQGDLPINQEYTKTPNESFKDDDITFC